MFGFGDNLLTWIALLLCICGLCQGVNRDGCGCDCGGTGNNGNAGGCGGCGGILGGCGSCR